jgi:hypothetical protein
MRNAEEFPGFPGASGHQGASGHRGGTETGRNDGELGIAWSAQFPVAGRRNDTWVLVCGGIVAAAAFVAAFVASGGAVSHAATTGNTVPAVVSQACPSSAAGPTP